MRRIIGILAVSLLVFGFTVKNTNNTDKAIKKEAKATASKKGAEQPNIIFVFADDMGYGDIKCNNPKSKLNTPNVDRLASQGARFTDVHSVGSLCAPSRFGLLTGRNPSIWEDYVDIESEAWNCLTMPQMFKKQGYNTVCVGKWHFGVLFEGKDGRWGAPHPVGKKFPAPADNWILTNDTRLGPNDRGFDYFFGTPLQPGGQWYANMENTKLLGNPKLSPKLPATKDFVIEKWMGVILNKTQEKINEYSKKDDPFFLYFPLNSPHKPIVPDEPFKGKSAIGQYGDYCEQVDWCLGEVMKTIDEAGISDNTIVIFTSDNGSYYYPGSVNSNQEDEEELKKNKHLANGGYKAGKGQPEEGGHRVPYIIRWPGQVEPGSVNNTTISLGDHFATFAALTGYELKQEDAIDSWNVLSILKGEKPQKGYEERALFHFNINPDVNAVRVGKWKMIPECYVKAKKPSKGKKGKLSPQEKKKLKTLIPGQLYDLSTDPGEQVNVWDKNPEVVKELNARLEEYLDKKHNASHIK